MLYYTFHYVHRGIPSAQVYTFRFVPAHPEHDRDDGSPNIYDMMESGYRIIEREVGEAMANAYDCKVYCWNASFISIRP
jgi:hypothetical protein